MDRIETASVNGNVSANGKGASKRKSAGKGKKGAQASVAFTLTRDRIAQKAKYGDDIVSKRTIKIDTDIEGTKAQVRLAGFFTGDAQKSADDLKALPGENTITYRTSDHVTDSDTAANKLIAERLENAIQAGLCGTVATV